MGGGKNFTILSGTAANVYEEDRTIDVALDNDVVLYDVKLRAVSNGDKDGFVCLPKKDSEVVFGKIMGQPDYVLLQTSELDKVIIETGVKVELKAPETVFNDGNNDGMVLLHELENNLNQIKTYLTAMNGAVSAALSTVDGTAGSASQGPYSSTMQAQQINFEDMENQDIKQ